MAQDIPYKSRVRIEAEAICDGFISAGAARFETDILLQAEVLLDLYGEDIRARAYVTTDPERGEMMLRPDFTVPVVERHMAEGAEPARYTYAGEVFRRQEEHPDRANEYVQVGFEVFDREDPEAADAEVFALFCQALTGHGLRAVTGDIGILTAAVSGLDTTEARRAALMRHIWRPRRFRALLDRFSGKTDLPPSRKALLAAANPMDRAGVSIGLREPEDVLARIEALRADQAQPRLARHQVEMLEQLLKVSEACPFALEQLRDIAVDMPAITAAVDRFARRCDAMDKRGVAVDQLAFEASYGRASMEYYDGFVFGFARLDRPDWPLVASGGRYDALTRQLGQGREIPAVGGVIRAGLLVELER